MRGRRKLHRYVAWAVILAAAATIAIALWQFREAISWRWYLFRNRPLIARAREQILGWESSFAPAETLTGALEKFQSDGEPGFRVIASLLEDEDPRVWVRTAELIDAHYTRPGHNLQLDSVHRVIAYLRSRDQRSLLKYLILPPYQHSTDWRNYAFYVDGGVVCHHFWYWSGEAGRTLRPAPDGIAFLEEVLFDRFSYDGVYHEPGNLKYRAVHALAAMWSPGTSSDGRNRQALAALERFIRSGQDPGLRLDALYSLGDRASAFEIDGDYRPGLYAWEIFAGICPPGSAENIYWNSFGEDDGEYFGKFYAPDSIAALLHLDHPRVLRVLSRLDRDPSMRERIAAVRLRCEPRLPVSGPEWFPLDATTRRLLEGPPDSRAAAFLCLAESQDRDAAELLRRALAKETVEDLRGLLKCCLYSLGETEHAGEAVRLLEGWLARDIRELQGGIPVSNAIGQILRAGDRALLDRVAGVAIRKYRPDLLFALADAIENFPLRTLLLVVRPPYDPQAGEDDAVENEPLSAWWQAHRETLTWDARRRVFFSGK